MESEEREGNDDRETSRQRQWWWRKLRTTAATTKEVSNDRSGGGGTDVRQQQKLQTTSWEEEASAMFVDGGESCSPLPLMVEGVAHESIDNGRNCARRLSCRTRPSTIKEASNLYVDNGGSDRGNINDGSRSKSCTRVYGYRSHGGARSGFCKYSKIK